jgi:Tfp pilus assembly pilus retraction ATPase PilT
MLAVEWYHVTGLFAAASEMSDLLLVPHLRPLARTKAGFEFTTLSTPTPSNLSDLVQKVANSRDARIERHEGYFSFDVARSPELWFRVAVLQGSPDGRMLVMRMPPTELSNGESGSASASPPPPVTPPAHLFEAPLAWDRTLETALRHGCDLILLSGTPPLLRSTLGIRGFCTRPLSVEHFDSMMREIMPDAASREITEFEGRLEFDLRYGTAARFRVAVVKHADRQSMAMLALLE